jgi:hypothetical protein
MLSNFVVYDIYYPIKKSPHASLAKEENRNTSQQQKSHAKQKAGGVWVIIQGFHLPRFFRCVCSRTNDTVEQPPQS